MFAPASFEPAQVLGMLTLAFISCLLVFSLSVAYNIPHLGR